MRTLVSSRQCDRLVDNRSGAAAAAAHTGGAANNAAGGCCTLGRCAALQLAAAQESDLLMCHKHMTMTCAPSCRSKQARATLYVLTRRVSCNAWKDSDVKVSACLLLCLRRSTAARCGGGAEVADHQEARAAGGHHTAVRNAGCPAQGVHPSCVAVTPAAVLAAESFVASLLLRSPAVATVVS